MTEKEIDEMEAGREMDALIHRRVFGHESLPYVDPPYSTDISAAWLVVEKLRELGFKKIAIEDGVHYAWEYYTEDSGMGRGFGTADALPLAICRAALKAVADCHKITTNEAGEPAEKTG